MLPMPAPYPGRATADMQSFYKKTMQARDAQLLNPSVGMSHYYHVSRVKNAAEMSPINQNLTVDRRALCFVVECFESLSSAQPFLKIEIDRRSTPGGGIQEDSVKKVTPATQKSCSRS